MKKIFTTFLFCTVAILSQANTYYVSSTGNDASNGKSINEAWKTLDAVNNFGLVPGDVVLLQGGATFSGNISKENIDKEENDKSGKTGVCHGVKTNSCPHESYPNQ